MAWVTLNDCLSTVAVSKGGTGLTSAPMLATDLASTSAVSIFQSAPRPGVVGILPVANGGTGATTASAALTNLGAASQDSVPRFIQSNAVRVESRNLQIITFSGIRVQSAVATFEVGGSPSTSGYGMMSALITSTDPLIVRVINASTESLLVQVNVMYIPA